MVHTKFLLFADLKVCKISTHSTNRSILTLFCAWGVQKIPERLNTSGFKLETHKTNEIL